MTALTAQRLIGLVFAVLGGWALLAPGMVIELTVRPEYQSDDFLARFAMGCFGAQAVIFALVAFTARFTRATFAAYGLSLFAFFAFNWYFYAVKPVLNEVGLLDLVGNIVMLALCWQGWRASGRDQPSR